MSRGRGQGGDGHEVTTRSAPTPTMDIMANQLGFRERWPELTAAERKDFVFPQMLDYVNFSLLNLSGADFSGRSLYGADLTGADISGANFAGADLRATNLHDVDLDEKTNLDEAAQKDWNSLKELKDRTEALPIIVENNGVESLRYWERNGMIHRGPDKPAVIWANGAKAYYVLDKMIRHEMPTAD